MIDPHHHNRFRLQSLLALTLCLLIMCNPASAQEEDPQARIFRSMGLETVPFNAETVGITFHLPAQAHVRVRQRGDQPVYVVSDSPEPKIWSLQIESVKLDTVSESWADADDFLNQILVRQTDYQLLSRESPQYGAVDARLCYIQPNLSSGGKAINGWLVLPSGRSSLIVVTILCMPEFFPDLKPLLDRSFSTIVLKTEEQRRLEQRARIEVGREFLASLTPQKLRSLTGLRQWFRTYRPVPADGSAQETEIACSLVEVIEARRGELNPNRPEDKYSDEEQELGLMVRLQGRVIVNVQRNIYYDTIAQYWMSWDQSSEAWSMVGTHRQGQASKTEAETGLRTAPSVGNPIPRITVIRADPTPFEWDTPDVYLSQPLAWLLGKTLPRDTLDSRVFSYYFYNARSSTPSITLRYDRWEPLGDGSGHWQLATLLDKNQPPDVSTYAADGSLIRRTQPNGTITEPTTRENLLRLWRSKGLRTGPSTE